MLKEDKQALEQLSELQAFFHSEQTSGPCTIRGDVLIYTASLDSDDGHAQDLTKHLLDWDQLIADDIVPCKLNKEDPKYQEDPVFHHLLASVMLAIVQATHEVSEDKWRQGQPYQFLSSISLNQLQSRFNLHLPKVIQAWQASHQLSEDLFPYIRSQLERIGKLSDFKVYEFTPPFGHISYDDLKEPDDVSGIGYFFLFCGTRVVFLEAIVMYTRTDEEYEGFSYLDPMVLTDEADEDYEEHEDGAGYFDHTESDPDE